MSSESCGQGQGEEKKQDEEVERQEVEVPCEDKQPTESLRQEESVSPDHRGMQEVTSEGGLEQVQREETQTQEERKRFSHMTVNQASRAQGSGVCGEQWDIKSFISVHQNTNLHISIL